ncbi:MAG: ATP synthase F1 subunit delta [Bacteroidales bacterium]|jgi:F-type H+-transporting ATPase subunit delta|nr:ATP synthase F1 subunit delta [Bacteroidales bacterium]
MNNSIISGRYAKALIQAGIAQNCLDALRDDTTLLIAAIKENLIFRQILISPVIKPSQKHGVMDELLGKRVHAMTLSFIHVLIKNKRDAMLYDIARRFITLYETYKGIKHACIISATTLDERVKNDLRQKLNTAYQADVQLASEVNANLIGGFILRVDDRRYDASLASGLNRMKQKLMAG